MTRRDTLEAMLDRYGEPVLAGEAKATAILRPLRFGPADTENSNYLYTGPAGLKLCAGDAVSTGSRSFEVARAETVSLAGEELYVRAVLREIPSQADEAVTLEAGGTTMAAAESYDVKLTRSCEASASWGETEPFGMAQRVSAYEISLNNVRPSGGTVLEDLQDFSVVIRHAGSKTVYAGCHLKAGEGSGGPGRVFRRNLTVLACSRTEEKEAAS